MTKAVLDLIVFVDCKQHFKRRHNHVRLIYQEIKKDHLREAFHNDQSEVIHIVLFFSVATLTHQQLANDESLKECIELFLVLLQPRHSFCCPNSEI